MPISRYTKAPILNLGEKFGSSNYTVVIRSAISSGRITTRDIILKGAERLDTLAGNIYGDSRYWWILAAASDIGWGMQIPPGTIIKIPNLDDIAALVA